MTIVLWNLVMETNTIEIRKTVVITHDFVNSNVGTFIKDIFVEFQPDEMIVRYSLRFTWKGNTNRC